MQNKPRSSPHLHHASLSNKILLRVNAAFDLIIPDFATSNIYFEPSLIEKIIVLFYMFMDKCIYKRGFLLTVFGCKAPFEQLKLWVTEIKNTCPMDPTPCAFVRSYSSILVRYIQNATLLTFMPPFISIYMFMLALILISQLHPYEKYREKGKTLTWYLNNSWGEKNKTNSKKNKKKTKQNNTIFLGVWKISFKTSFTDVEFHEQNLPFWSNAEQYHN